MKIKMYMLIIVAIICFIGYKYFSLNSISNSSYKALNNELKTHKEKIRELEIERLQNPEIIIDNFKKVGNLVIYEGEVKYKDIIKEKSFWGKKTLDLNLEYNFGMVYPLNKIEVIQIIDKLVVVKVPKEYLQIGYVELNNTSFNSSKTWFTSNFKAEDVQIILDQSKEKVKQNIINNKNIYSETTNSLNDRLKELILKLGYEKIVFE